MVGPLVIAVLLLVNTLQRRRQLQRAAEVSPNPMLVPSTG